MFSSVCSQSTLTHNGATLTNTYQLNLGSLCLGSRVGVIRCADGSLRYYLDGVDQGVACSSVPPGQF